MTARTPLMVDHIGWGALALLLILAAFVWVAIAWADTKHHGRDVDILLDLDTPTPGERAHVGWRDRGEPYDQMKDQAS